MSVYACFQCDWEEEMEEIETCPICLEDDELYELECATTDLASIFSQLDKDEQQEIMKALAGLNIQSALSRLPN